MALTLASNAITFTDNTSLSSGIIGTAQLSAGAVTADKIADSSITTQTISNSAITAEKMSGGQTGDAPVYGCRAWVNFSGIDTVNTPQNLPALLTVRVSAGNDFGFWDYTSANYNSTPYIVGVRYWLPVLNGVAGGLLGGADVSSSTNAIQFTEIVSSTRLKFRFTNGQIPTTDAEVTSNNTTDFQYQSYGIRESGNVASIVRNSTGDYTVNFITPMKDPYYSVNVLATGPVSYQHTLPFIAPNSVNGSYPTTTSFSFTIFNPNNSSQRADPTHLMVQVIGN